MRSDDGDTYLVCSSARSCASRRSAPAKAGGAGKSLQTSLVRSHESVFVSVDGFFPARLFSSRARSRAGNKRPWAFHGSERHFDRGLGRARHFAPHAHLYPSAPYPAPQSDHVRLHHFVYRRPRVRACRDARLRRRRAPPRRGRASVIRHDGQGGHSVVQGGGASDAKRRDGDHRVQPHEEGDHVGEPCGGGG